MSIPDILAGLRPKRLLDEDGTSLRFEVCEGVSDGDLRAREKALAIRLPPAFRELLLLTNGMSFFGLEVLSLEEVEYFRDPGMVTFHDWSNGDFDCIATSGSSYQEGTILFMNHSPEVVVPIVPSLEEWISRAVSEIEKKGTLLHPGDYRFREEEGLYEHVLKALRGVDCELHGGVERNMGERHREDVSKPDRFSAVRELLADPDLEVVEKVILKRTGAALGSVRAEVLLPLLEKDIDTSKLAARQILEVVRKHRNLVTEFAIRYLQRSGRRSERQVLAPGFVVGYAIYVEYLRNKSGSELLDYLKRMRIPRSRQMARDMRRVFSQIRVHD